MDQPTRPTQPSIPLGLRSNPCNNVYYGVETITRQAWASYGCLVEGQSPWAHSWTMAYTPALCNTKVILRHVACGVI